MRIMGLDYGSKTVGVAVCDPLGITAQAVETITRKDENKLRQTLARIEALAKEYEVEKFVLGYPKNMNNTVGDRAQKSEELKASAKNNTEKDFEFAYFDNIDDALIEGLNQNQDFFSLLLGNDEIKKEVLGIFAEEIYRGLRAGE